MKSLPGAELARHLEAILIRPDATRPEVERICSRAREHGFYGVAMPGSRVELAATLLEDSEVKVIALVGYPSGTQDGDTKRFEAETAMDQGAQEFELVANIGRLKDGEHRSLLREIRDVVEAVDERFVRAAFETSWLTEDEMRIACELTLESGARVFSAGLGGFPAAESSLIRDLRGLLGERFGLKAAGRTTAKGAKELLEAGASLLCLPEPWGLLAGPGETQE